MDADALLTRYGVGDRDFSYENRVYTEKCLRRLGGWDEPQVYLRL